MELLFRPRRLRRREPLRRMVRETHLRPEDFIYPMFAAPGSGVRQEVPSMPGVARLSADLLVDGGQSRPGRGRARGPPLRAAHAGKTTPAPRPPPPRARCSRRCGCSKNSCPNWW